MNAPVAARSPGRSPMRFRFDADPRSVRHALHFIDDALERQGVPPPARARAELALAEIFNNIVEHAYRGHPLGAVNVALTLGRELVCHVTDTGHPLGTGTIPLSTLPEADADDPPEGGFGWPLIYALTRNIAYRRTTGCNNLSFAMPLAG